MKAWFLALLALQADPPGGPLDRKDPKSVLAHAIFNTRTQKSYETAYTSRLEVPTGRLDYKGRTVWVSPGVLYIHYTGSGKDEQKIVRAGDQDVWLHHAPSGEWGTAAQIGIDGAGRGVQNPDEVLAVLSKHAATATFLKSGAIDVTFAGDDLVRIMKNQGQVGVLDPKASKARVEIDVDDAVRIRRFRCDASLVNLKGEVFRYASEVAVGGYNEAIEIAFTDEKNRPIPLRPEMKDRIEAVLNPKK